MKNEILQTALKQFLKYGIREISIQKLIEPLGISTKTVYKYFKNKEALLEDVLHFYHDKQYEMLNNLPFEKNAACLFFDVWQIAVETQYKVNRDFYADLRYYYPELEKRVNAAIGKKFESFFESIIHRGIEQGDFRDDVHPGAALRSVLVLLTAVVQTDDFKKFRLSATDLLLNTIAVYIRGLCTQKGIQALEEHIQTVKLPKNAVMAG
jgi:AcrR family transcriptional regulator